MDEEVLSILKANKIFSSLDDEACRRLLPKLSEAELSEGEVLFQQGDPSDSIFLLVRGKLSVAITTATSEPKVIGCIEAGGIVGELGALTNEPRSMTVKALRPCILLRLTNTDFIELCHLHPTVMYATVHPVIVRTQNSVHMLKPDKKDKHIVILPANKTVSLKEFAEKLIDITATFQTVITVTDFQAEYDINDLNLLKEKIATLEKSKKSSHRIIYILKAYNTPLAKLCFKKMDRLYIVGTGHSAPEIDTFILDKINSNKTQMQTDPGLILLHTERRGSPRNTASWLAQIPFSLHHHVRIDLTKDYQRLLRFIRDRAVGIVLSGGGTRGWAHIGAMRALREAKIPIDIIGGTSVGAIIAACYAMEESAEDAYEKFYRIIRASKNAVSWRNLTWPAVSLFNAKGFTTAQMEVFGDTQIDDLWIPFFCVSCNLSSNTEEIHHSGLLWEKTRASASVPGLIPPMILDGALHLDGGLLNNLPVDVMRQYVGKRGKVIAIELNNFSSDRHKYHFPPILTFKQTLFSRLGLGEHIYKFPRFVETFLRGLFVGSLAKSRQNSLGTNVMINLNLSKFRLLHSNPKQAERLIEIGYQETLHRLSELKGKKDS